MLRRIYLAGLLVLAIHTEAAAQGRPQIGLSAATAIKREWSESLPLRSQIDELQVDGFLEQKISGPLSLQWSLGYEARRLVAGYRCLQEQPDCIIKLVAVGFRGDYVHSNAFAKLTDPRGAFRPYLFAGPGIAYRFGKRGLGGHDPEDLNFSDLRSVVYRGSAGLGAEVAVGRGFMLLTEIRRNRDFTSVYTDDYEGPRRFFELCVGVKL